MTKSYNNNIIYNNVIFIWGDVPLLINFKGDELNIEYIDKGTGDVIVFLQGWGTKASIYQCLIDVLSEKYRVIAPDFPGFGNSTEPSFPYATEDYTDFVLALLESLGIKRASFIGHSHGGRVIIEMASRENLPINIDKIVLIDSAGIVSKKKLSKRIRIRTYKILKHILLIKPVKKMFPDALKALKKKFGSADYSSSSEIMQKSMVKLVNTDYSHRLSKISVPVLLIWGEKDDATPLSHAKIMEKQIQDSGLIVIKGAGHFSYTEDLPLAQRVLRSFFNI